jgi:hypothetical protein
MGGGGVDTSRTNLRLTIRRMGGVYRLRLHLWRASRRMVRRRGSGCGKTGLAGLAGRRCSRSIACVAHVVQHLSSSTAVVPCGAVVGAAGAPAVVLRRVVASARGAVGWSRVRKIVGGLVRRRSWCWRVLARRLRRCVLGWRGLVGGVLLRRALLPVLVVVTVVVGRHGCGKKEASRLSRGCRSARGVHGHG